jgi:hypothetical protein
VSYFALPVLFFGTLARTPVAAVLDPALMLGFGIVVLATFLLGMLSTRLLSQVSGRGACRHEPAGDRGLLGQCRLHGGAALPGGVWRGRPAARHADRDRDGDSSPW